MLSYIRHNDSFIKNMIDSLDNILRKHDISPLFHLKRVFLLPALNFLHPLFCILLFRVLQHLFDCFLCVRYNRHIHMDILGDGRRINIDMYNLCVRRKRVQLSCDPVIESCTDGKQHIALFHRHIGRVGSVHTKVCHIIRMIRRNSASSHYRCDHRNFRLFHQSCKGFIGFRNIHSASCKKQRSLRVV